ncbi:alpha/beta fold hydrolase [Patiriisocius sp. Uisw_017]|jgi:pimeloyl-ACP methyl ester carboxylesterase|uniref:alpha/beta fold hydrolase n=1 Tax=Patiriisocius sp. Uisw_017 TaxID=3230968 RepID=UPI0039EC0AB8
MKEILLKLIGAYINITAFLFPKWNAKHSFKLLTKVKRAGITEKGMEFLSQAQQTYFEEEGQSSVLYKWGNGPKNVLFLHGWMSNSQRWIPYHKKIDLEKYTMYAMDAPGHGRSKTNYLNLEMYRQAIVKAMTEIGEIDTVVGHSFSNTALTYAYLVNPKVNVKKFVIMGSPSGMDAIFVYFKEMLRISKRATKILDLKINSILKVPHQEILVKNLLTKASQPILLIHDQDDKITPFAPIKKAIEGTPKIETLITKGLKHDLKSEEVYNSVINFIERTDLTINFTQKIKEECI